MKTKRNFVMILALYSTVVFAQDDTIEVERASSLTEIGKPVGEKISQRFDKSGGKIVSADGRMELTIPQDALSSKTNISIQPVGNTLAPGQGSAYELEPSGISFQKPLQLTFHYTEKESIDITPGFTEIAWQDDKGQWYQLENSMVDTLARTITGNITHFSTWVFFDSFILQPTAARVKVNKQLDLIVVCTLPRPNSAGGVITDETLPRQIRFSTYVDGVRGGNAVVGTVSSVVGQNIRNVKYSAPANIPDNNPVALSVEATNIKWNGRVYSKLKLISNITVFDRSYEITIIGYNKQHAGRCTLSGIDSSTCILQLNGNRSKLQDVQNMNYKITISGCPCKVTEVNAGTSTGPVNILGATKIDIQPANPPGKPYAFVTIYFTRNIGTMPAMQGDPCGNVPNSSQVMTFAAIPLVLAFEAKDEAYTVAKQGGDNGFEIRVKPVKEER